jgi:ABC-2 type transport system ATP-binding protein/lipopolysaccharide transport system ATP-binding protein
MASITLEKVSVSFPVYSSATRSIKNRLIQSATGGQIRSESGSDRISVVQALQDINLQLESGDRIGLVGHNGAGKTTLLRVLGGIYEPNEGQVLVRGSTVPLFDISLGMDPESTGYENIVLRGLYLGLSRSQMRGRLDEIADFTELGDFLNLPISTYSAGMRMRLAFAVSTSVAPDILLIDEGIGAGDAAFLQKASERLKLFTEQVSIIVLSSHSEDLIKRMCNKAVLMEHGRVVGSGSTQEVLTQYRQRQEAAGSVEASVELPLEIASKAATRSDASAWAMETARFLRQGRWDAVYVDRLVEEVVALVDPDRDLIEGQLAYLLVQLLAWHERESERSELRREIIDQVRRQTELMIKQDKEIAGTAKESLESAYRRARSAAARRMGIDASRFPAKCPVALPLLLDPTWFPGEGPSDDVTVARRQPTDA